MPVFDPSYRLGIERPYATSIFVTSYALEEAKLHLVLIAKGHQGRHPCAQQSFRSRIR